MDIMSIGLGDMPNKIWMNLDQHNQDEGDEEEIE